MSETVAIRCEHVSKTVETQEEPLSILQDVELSIHEGESVAIVGQSGSGKTTLLSLLAGLDTPSSGDVSIYGESVKQRDEDGRAALRQQYIGFVFQSFHLLPGFTALENVMLPLEMQDDKSAMDKAKQWLERVGMSHRLNHYPATLSGGEQQRVAIARAFAAETPLLMADEPTGNLDAETGQHIMDLLFELNAERTTTLVLVTHDAALAKRCQRRLRLQQGVLQEQA